MVDRSATGAPTGVLPDPPTGTKASVVTTVQRILRFVGDRQARRWDRFGGPGPVLRWCFSHPWLVTVALAGVLAVALGAVFGVPPFSPLVLVIVLVSPVAPVLRVLSRIHDRWVGGHPDAATDPDTPSDPGPTRDDGPARDTGATSDPVPGPDTDTPPAGSGRSPSAPPDERG